MRILLFLVSLIGLGTVVAIFLIGSGRYEQTVVSDPYETGLRWDAEQLDRERSGWNVQLAIKRIPTGKQELDIAVNDSSGRSLDGANVELRFLRPFTTIAERPIPARRTPSGMHRAEVHIPERGRWPLQITVELGGSRIVFEEVLDAE